MNRRIPIYRQCVSWPVCCKSKDKNTTLCVNAWIWRVFLIHVLKEYSFIQIQFLWTHILDIHLEKKNTKWNKQFVRVFALSSALDSFFTFSTYQISQTHGKIIILSQDYNFISFPIWEHEWLHCSNNGRPEIIAWCYNESPWPPSVVVNIHDWAAGPQVSGKRSTVSPSPKHFEQTRLWVRQ